MQNGKVVGVAFQGYSGDVAQGVAYMIPTPVIQRFLKDIADGHYDRYVDLGITYSKLQNPAQRRFLGLQDDDRGVLVTPSSTPGPAAKFVAERSTCFLRSMIIRSRATPLSNSRANACRCRKWSSENSKATRSSSILCANKQPLTVEVTLGYGLAVLHAGPQLRCAAALRRLWRTAFSTAVARSDRGLSAVSDLRVRHFFDFFVIGTNLSRTP